MAKILLFTGVAGPADRVWPALTLLPHRVETAPATTSSLTMIADAEVLIVDCRADLARAYSLCQLLAEIERPPVLALLGDGGWSVLSPSWDVQGAVAETASPAEVDARIRMLLTPTKDAPREPERVERGDLVIDPTSYVARLRGEALDLTYKEFELLRHLAANPGRVYTRAQLLHEVWGYDYYGGTRTVDVHVRRLRAKLGVEYDQMIGTVRNVGYRFDPEGIPMGSQ